MSTDSVSLVAVIIIFYFISIIYTYTKALAELAHTYPQKQQKPGASTWGQVLGSQYQGNREIFIFKIFPYLSEIKI